MKKLGLLLLTLLLIVSCGRDPKVTVDKFIKNVQTKKFEQAAKYAINNEFSKDMTLKYDNKTQQLFFESLFKNMKYEIINSEKQPDGSYNVKVSVDNIDVQKVFLTIYQKLFQEAFTGKGTQLSVEDEFKKVLESESVPKAKNETIFKVVKTSKGYKLDVSPENIDVLFGKFNSTLSNLNNLGEEETTTEAIQQAPVDNNLQKIDPLKPLNNK